MALWTHYIANELCPDLLTDMPDRTDQTLQKITGTNGTTTTTTITANNTTTASETASDESNLETAAVVPPVVVVATNGELINLTYCCDLIELILIFFLIILGVIDSLDESTRSEDSLEPNTPIIANDETNDSDSQSSAKR